MDPVGAINGPIISGATGTMKANRGSKHAVMFTASGRRMTLSGPPLTTFSFISEVPPNGIGITIAQSVAISGPLALVFGR